MYTCAWYTFDVVYLLSGEKVVARLKPHFDGLTCDLGSIQNKPTCTLPHRILYRAYAQKVSTAPTLPVKFLKMIVGRTMQEVRNLPRLLKTKCCFDAV